MKWLKKLMPLIPVDLLKKKKIMMLSSGILKVKYLVLLTNLATTATLTAVENKIPSVTDLVKKTDYDAKISEIENKYFSTSDFNEFTNAILDANIIKN